MASLLALVLALLINVTSTGATTVTMTVLPSGLYVNYTLPVAAYVSTMYAVNACTGHIVGIVPGKTFVIVPGTVKQCPIIVRYVAYTEPINYTMFLLTVDLRNFTKPARVYFASNIVFIPPPGSLVLPNGTLILKPGNVYKIEYTVLPPVTPAPRHRARTGAPTHVTPPKTPTRQQQTTTPSPSPYPAPGTMIYIIAAIAIVAIAIAGVVVAFRKRTTRAVEESPFIVKKSLSLPQ